MINSYRLTLRWLICTLLFTATYCIAESNSDIDPAWAFNKNGPIFVGQIISIKIDLKNSAGERGTLLVHVTEQLRGERLPSSFNLPFVWADIHSPSFMLNHSKGPLPTGFGRLQPIAGMKILCMIDPEKPAKRPPLEVLDISSDADNWVSLVKSSIARDNLATANRKKALLCALSDHVKFTREVALHNLLEQCWHETSCRNKAVAIECHRSKIGPESERVQAISALWEFYEPTAKNTATNRRIVSNFFSLIPDQNKQVRQAAIAYARFVYFSGAYWAPDVNTLDIQDRAAVIDVLEKEAKRKTEGAKHLADLLRQGT